MNIYLKNQKSPNSISFEGIKPMMEILEKFGGWPVVEGDWDFEKWNWMEANKFLSNSGLSDGFILQFFIFTDYKNSTKRAMGVRFTTKSEQKINLITYFQYWLCCRFTKQALAYRRNFYCEESKTQM